MVLEPKDWIFFWGLLGVHIFNGVYRGYRWGYIGIHRVQGLGLPA